MARALRGCRRGRGSGGHRDLRVDVSLTLVKLEYHRGMSATRLLVLGAIRILAPVHGYDVRRELLTWRLEELANVKPGSIYSAIRTLEKDGCIAVHSRESEESRPERTTYVITAEGEKEFQILLRETWWTVRSSTEPLIPALCLMPFMPRDELIAALSARLGTLRGELDSALVLPSYRARRRDRSGR